MRDDVKNPKDLTFADIVMMDDSQVLRETLVETQLIRKLLQKLVKAQVTDDDDDDVEDYPPCHYCGQTQCDCDTL